MARKSDKRTHASELAVSPSYREEQHTIPSPLRNFQFSRLNDYIQTATGKSLNGIFKKLCLHFYGKNDRFTINTISSLLAPCRKYSADERQSSFMRTKDSARCWAHSEHRQPSHFPTLAICSGFYQASQKQVEMALEALHFNTILRLHNVLYTKTFMVIYSKRIIHYFKK